jgi:hypothetical protein
VADADLHGVKVREADMATPMTGLWHPITTFLLVQHLKRSTNQIDAAVERFRV